MPGKGVVWIEGLLTVADGAGKERLIARYMRMKDLGTMLEWEGVLGLKRQAHPQAHAEGRRHHQETDVLDHHAIPHFHP